MISATFDIEQKYWKLGYGLVCGVDEVGRGCFAGPVAAGAVIFKPQAVLPKNIRDSKLLTKLARNRLEPELKSLALAWAVALVDVVTINEIGIGRATQLAFKKAVEMLGVEPQFILIDALMIDGVAAKMQLPIIRGDQLSASIAAAAILAKVERDRVMDQLAIEYPEYGFEVNKGYGTLKHRQAIGQYGLSKMHRTSFKLDKFINHAS
jgi:ribonuclease HII